MVDLQLENNLSVAEPSQAGLHRSLDLNAPAGVRRAAIRGNTEVFLRPAEHLRRAAVDQAVAMLLIQEQAGSPSAAALRIGLASLHNAVQDFSARPCRVDSGLLCLRHARLQIQRLSAPEPAAPARGAEAAMRDAWDGLLRFSIKRHNHPEDPESGRSQLRSAERALIRAARLAAQD